MTLNKAIDYNLIDICNLIIAHMALQPEEELFKFIVMLEVRESEKHVI
jgi:hypothetical protein